MIAGFIAPTSGTVRLAGRDLTRVKPAARGLGIVFQSYALFPHMTVAENVGFGLEMRGLGRTERDARIKEALALVGLASFGERYPRRMSGGQQQRVALARALVIRPPVLLLDEPLSNLDAKLREGMQAELRAIQRTTGTTTILVTHDQSEAMALSDRIVVMNQGRIEQIATPEQAYAKPASAFVAGFLGKTNRLDGVSAAGQVTVAGATFAAPAGTASGPVTVSVRPERIAFGPASPAAIAGRVATRVFQGAHWLFEVETAQGPVSVIRQNSGEAVPGEGDSVHLHAAPHDLLVTGRQP
jgi:putative spermidine/putrescine transport system ATP-binding protein